MASEIVANKNSTEMANKQEDLNIALMEACEKGKLEDAKNLIEKGAHVNYKHKNDDTPLIRASENGHLEVVELLLSKGATVDDKDMFGRSPLYMASQNGHA
jgi:ankyrin repeat protein